MAMEALVAEQHEEEFPRSIEGCSLMEATTWAVSPAQGLAGRLSVKNVRKSSYQVIVG